MQRISIAMSGVTSPNSNIHVCALQLAIYPLLPVNVLG